MMLEVDVGMLVASLNLVVLLLVIFIGKWILNYGAEMLVENCLILF